MHKHPAFVTMSAGSSPMSRRSALRLAGLAAAGVCLRHAPQPAHALKPGKPSKEKLLGNIREERTPEEIEEERARVAEEKRQRLERQRELQASAERRKAGLEADATEGTEIESNLRGQYYFPTARKRYLPRVKVAFESLDAAESAARGGQWREVREWREGALGDAVLPMRLYVSSLGGGGLNISAKFLEQMGGQAERYERALKALDKAAKRKDAGAAAQCVADMRGAMQEYRRFGKLEAADFGIGEVSTQKRSGSGFGNNNAALYVKNRAMQEATGKGGGGGGGDDS